MSEFDRREELLQDHMEGRIGEEELRRRLGHRQRTSDLEAELAAYGAVWEAAGTDPESRLPADFARRTARAAAAGESRARGSEGAMATLVAAASLAAACAAAAGAGLLLPLAGVEPGLLLQAAGDAAARTPAAVLGAAGAAAVLFAGDRLWISRTRGADRST